MREELSEPNLPDPGPRPASEPPFGSSPDVAPGPAFAQHRTPLDELNARPHIFVGGYHVSLDQTQWRTGSTWVFGPPPSRATSSGLDKSTDRDGVPATNLLQVIIAIGGLILFAAVAFSMCQSMPGTSGVPGP